MSTTEARNDNDNELDSFLSKSFLDLEKIAKNLYRSKDLWQFELARGIYGGQIIGQALVAASKSIPENQHLHSFHSYFLHPGESQTPILYHTENTRDGRTYASRNVKATQDGKAVFTMEASFKTFEDRAFSFQVPMPDVPSFSQIQEYTEVLEALNMKGEISDKRFIAGKTWFSLFPIEIKWLDVEDSLLRAPREPRRRLWFRAKGHISEETNHNIHKCCIGYMSDLFLVHTSLLPLAPLQGKKYFQVSLDHSMWFHAPCRADEWMLFEIRTESTGDGRTFCHGLIWDQQGTLVTTIAQEGVLRINAKI